MVNPPTAEKRAAKLISGKHLLEDAGVLADVPAACDVDVLGVTDLSNVKGKGLPGDVGVSVDVDPPKLLFPAAPPFTQLWTTLGLQYPCRPWTIVIVFLYGPGLDGQFEYRLHIQSR